MRFERGRSEEEKEKEKKERKKKNIEWTNVPASSACSATNPTSAPENRMNISKVLIREDSSPGVPQNQESSKDCLRLLSTLITYEIYLLVSKNLGTYTKYLFSYDRFSLFLSKVQKTIRLTYFWPFAKFLLSVLWSEWLGNRLKI